MCSHRHGRSNVKHIKYQSLYFYKSKRSLVSFIPGLVWVYLILRTTSFVPLMKSVPRVSVSHLYLNLSLPLAAHSSSDCITNLSCTQAAYGPSRSASEPQFVVDSQLLIGLDQLTWWPDLYGFYLVRCLTLDAIGC